MPESTPDTPSPKSLGLLCLLLLLATRLWNMATLSLWDPSEARYATLAANMARSGDYLRPAFFHHDCFQTFAGKPPLSFQLGALCCRLLGESAFAVRLPSLLCACAILLLLYRLTRTRQAPLLCATMIGLALFSGICMTDLPLTAAVFATLAAGYRYLRRPRWTPALLCATAAAAGVLIKGPVALLLGGLPLFLFALLNRRPLRRRHLLGAGLLFLLLATPWFIAMEIREPGTLSYFFLNENLGRFLTQNYGDRYGSGHRFFPGVAIPWFLLLAFPWSLHLLRRPLWRRLRANFPALATLTIIAFWCCTPRVPLAYLLPALPPFAWWLARHPAPTYRLWPGAAYLLALLLFLGTLLLPWLNPHKYPRDFYAALPPTATHSFVGSAPYSAEFYLSSRVRRDGSGDLLIRRQGRHFTVQPNPHPQAEAEAPQAPGKKRPGPARLQARP